MSASAISSNFMMINHKISIAAQLVEDLCFFLVLVCFGRCFYKVEIEIFGADWVNSSENV